MLYAFCVFIGLVIGVFATAICARGKVSDLEMKIYRKEGRSCDFCGWIKEEIHKIIVYPTKEQGHRADDGYPSELIYDEFAYKRMVNSFRNGLKDLLKAFENKIHNNEKL